MKSELPGFRLRLTEKMQERGITMADLCRLTGTATSMISYYCSGKRVPTIAVAIKIADALGTTLEYLAQGKSYSEIGSADGLVAEKEIPYSSKKPKTVKPSGELESPKSLELLEALFHSLNQDGQIKVVSYIEDLLSSGKYNSHGM